MRLCLKASDEIDIFVRYLEKFREKGGAWEELQEKKANKKEENLRNTRQQMGKITPTLNLDG